MEINIVSERSWFECESHTLQNHFLIKERCAEDGFAKMVDEITQLSSRSCLTVRRDRVVV